MKLITHQCQVSDEMAAAMRRGLLKIGEPEVEVLVSGEFVEAVEELEPDSGPYDTDRGLGTVAGKTIHSGGKTTILVNHSVMSNASLVDVEHLLAHEGGHAILHAHSEAMSPLRNDRSTTGLAMLRGLASTAIEEFRVERKVAELGYSAAGLATPDSLNDRLFDFCYTIIEALHDPTSDDVVMFANRVLIAQHRLTFSLSYLAGAVVGGQTAFSADQLSDFARQYWNETIDRSWQARLQLYRRIPAAGTPWGGSLAATHLQQAVDVERKLLRDVGFTINGNDLTPGAPWAFRRTGTDAMFATQEERLMTDLGRHNASQTNS